MSVHGSIVTYFQREIYTDSAPIYIWKQNICSRPLSNGWLHLPLSLHLFLPHRPPLITFFAVTPVCFSSFQCSVFLPPVSFMFRKITLSLLWLILQKCIGGRIESVQTGGLVVLRGGVLRGGYLEGRKQRSGGDIKPHTA